MTSAGRFLPLRPFGILPLWKQWLKLLFANSRFHLLCDSIEVFFDRGDFVVHLAICKATTTNWFSGYDNSRTHNVNLKAKPFCKPAHFQTSLFHSRTIHYVQDLSDIKAMIFRLIPIQTETLPENW